MDYTQKVKLIKLGQATIDDKLGYDGFSMFTWLAPIREDGSDTPCGTVCCMIGGCPNVFPGEWVTGSGHKYAGPRLAGEPAEGHTTTDSAMKFFGLSIEEFQALFEGQVSSREYGAEDAGIPLSMIARDSADREECGQAVIDFANWKTVETVCQNTQ